MAKEKAKSDDGVRYFRVLESARFIAGPGEQATLAKGSVISTLTHDVELCRRQGIRLERCDAPEVRPPPETAQSLMDGPSPGATLVIALDALDDVAMGEGDGS